MIIVKALNVYGEDGRWAVGEVAFRGHDVAALVEVVATGKLVADCETIACWQQAIASARDAGWESIIVVHLQPQFGRRVTALGYSMAELVKKIETD